MKGALLALAVLFGLMGAVLSPAFALAQTLEDDLAGECEAAYKWPGDISRCLKEKMEMSDDALQATYKKLLQDSARLDSSTDKSHAKMLARKAMAFDAERETHCLQQRDDILREAATKHARRDAQDRFMSCRTIFNHRQIAALGGDISTYQPASPAKKKGVRAEADAYNE